MKKQSNTMFTKFGKDELTDLTNDVKETIAFGLGKPFPKIFTVAGLWNIQKQAKARLPRRYL